MRIRDLARGKALRKTLVYGGSALSLAVALTLALAAPRGTGNIRHRGRLVRIPVPDASLRFDTGEDRATYLMFGYPNYPELLAARGRDIGWRFVDQMGSMHTMASTPDGKMQLHVSTALRTQFFTQLEYRLDE